MPYGMQGHIGIARETTWGTPVAAADYFKALSESVVLSIDRFETINIHGALYEADDSAGIRRISGDISMPAHPVSVGWALKGVFGLSTVTSVAAATQVNVFTFATTAAGSLNPLPGSTLEIYRPGETGTSSAFQIAGAQVSQMTLSVAPNQDVRVGMSIIGKAYAGLAKTSPTFPASSVEAFTFDTTSIQLAGAAIDRVESLTFTFDNQLEGVPTLNNSTNISRARRTGPQTVRVSGVFSFVDFTDYNAFVSQTEQRLVASWTKTASFAMVVDVPRMVFTAAPVQMAGRDRITVDFEAMGRYHVGSASAVKVTLTTINSF